MFKIIAFLENISMVKNKKVLDYFKIIVIFLIERLNKTLGGQIMTNKKTFKFQFSTLVVIALITILSVACKNKVTASANLSAEAGTEEVINGGEDSADNKDTANDTVKIVEGSFVSGEFTATIKGSQITIGYKDWYGGQGPLVIKAEGKTPIKAKNSRFGFNFIIGGINGGTRYLVTDATPNYDAKGNLTSIAFTSKYDGQKLEVKF